MILLVLPIFYFLLPRSERYQEYIFMETPQKPIKMYSGMHMGA
jgi:hypothetical protein